MKFWRRLEYEPARFDLRLTVIAHYNKGRNTASIHDSRLSDISGECGHFTMNYKEDFVDEGGVIVNGDDTDDVELIVCVVKDH